MVHGGSAQELFTGTKDVADTHKFNEANLEAWMAENVEGFEGPLTVKQVNRTRPISCLPVAKLM